MEIERKKEEKSGWYPSRFSIPARRTLSRPEEGEFFLRLYGLQKLISDLPPIPRLPHDMESRRADDFVPIFGQGRILVSGW
jgi:hypothetical protein